MYESYRNPYQYQNPYAANLNMQNNPIQDNMIVSVPSEQERMAIEECINRIDK